MCITTDQRARAAKTVIPEVRRHSIKQSPTARRSGSLARAAQFQVMPLQPGQSAEPAASSLAVASEKQAAGVPRG